MRERNNNKETHNVEKFVDQLIHPPTLYPTRRRVTSQKHGIEQAAPKEEVPWPISRPSPTKSPRPQSEDKPSSIFISNRSYVDPGPYEQSAILISELSDTPTFSLPGGPQKSVKFRQSLIFKNEHNRRDTLPSDCRTPSILKRSRLLRQKTIQNIHSTYSGSEQSQIDRMSTLGSQDRQARAYRSNEVIKKRYFTILERMEAKLASKHRKGMHIRSDQKYKDELFPPIISSIYRGGSPRNNEPFQTDNIRWMRLPELFKGKPLCILPNGRSNIEIYCNRWQVCNNFIGDTFTAVKDCRTLLESIFQIKEVSDLGVYLVRIFQENVWKYVIVDDYIPTVTDPEGLQVPLFVNICVMGTNQQSKAIQLWPFLLEKAYASYYANYESLHFGDTLDFVEQITGSASEVFEFSRNVKKNNQITTRLGNYFNRENIVMLGFIEQLQVYMPIYRNLNNKLVSKRSFEGESEEANINIDNVFDYFDRVFAVLPGKWTHHSVSTVGINHKRIPGEIPRCDVSIRTLKVSQSGQVAISVRQKEKRFYQSSSLNYKYFWIRVFLFQKEFDGSCRWVAGRYSQNKTINIVEYLEAGQYYLIFLPEWKCSHCYQISVIALSTVPVSLHRREYDDKDKIVEKGCEDLAQRQGKLQQISMYACSYCVVEEDVGIMIENINNERFNGDIRINRSIGSIKGEVEVIPFNYDFYQHKTNRVPFRTQISIRIPPDGAYTVLLMTRGGIDRTLLKKFDFAK